MKPAWTSFLCPITEISSRWPRSFHYHLVTRRELVLPPKMALRLAYRLAPARRFRRLPL